MDDENTATEPVVGFPIGETAQADDTFCVPCQKKFDTPGGKTMHDRWTHNAEVREKLIRGIKKGVRKRTADGRVPRLVGRIPNGSKLPKAKKSKTFECGFCTEAPLYQTESGLRYHLAHDHKIHSIQANRDALAKRGIDDPSLKRRQYLKIETPPKPEMSKTEVMATIEVVRIGSEVYGRIVTT